MKQSMSLSIFPESLVYIFYIYESTYSGVPANGIIQYVDLCVWFLSFFFFFLAYYSVFEVHSHCSIYQNVSPCLG